MTSKLHKRLQTIFASIGIVALVTLIVLLWVYVGGTGTKTKSSTGVYENSDFLPPNFRNLNTTTEDSSRQTLDTNTSEEIRPSSPPSHVLGYVQNVNTELVRLEKISPPPLDDQDDTYAQPTDQKRGKDGATVNVSTDSEDVPNNTHHHHTGHFRHLHTEIWDPHPQYIINAFGHKLHLVLRQNAKFLRSHGGPPDGRIEVTHVFRNHVKKVKTQSRPAGCFYSGKVKGEIDSNIAVSLCGGMTGYIHAREGNFYIEPAEYIANTSSSSIGTSVLHRIHRVNTTSRPVTANTVNNADGETCGTDTNSDSSKMIFDDLIENTFRNTNSNSNNIDDVDDINNNDYIDDIVDNGNNHQEQLHHRVKKRNTWVKHYADTSVPVYTRNGGGRNNEGGGVYQNKNREYFIETLIVADKEMYEFHRTDDQLYHYILILMSHVSLLYKDATIGNPISISVVYIMVLHDYEFVEPKGKDYDPSVGVNSDEMLKEFCNFQHKFNKKEGTIGHHDTALLLTRQPFCRNAHRNKCDTEKTLGLAELGTMCNPKSSCAIIRDTGLTTSFTIAHELGHVLSMPHDDDSDKCDRFIDRNSDEKYIMSRVITNDTLPWFWSQCSKKYLTHFLESNQARCLHDLPETDLIQNASRNLPGENFDADKQCELIFGKGIKLCSFDLQTCQQLWCELDTEIGTGCIQLPHPWADGTPCDVDSWCYRGECIRRDLNILTPVAGGWGRWRHWGTCSRTCGGGIRRAERECDSPRPQNGGPYCIGPSVRYESCNTEPCDESAIDFREEQCAAFNDNTPNIPGLKGNVKWVPKYGGLLPEEMCKLYCQHANQHYLFSERVRDGTKCGYNNFDICVNGICRKGGCDNKLDSNLTLDSCGVCGGDNSQCGEVTGTYNAQPTYGYSKVLRIPKGSSNLDIRQHGHGGTNNDGNYLALVDSETGAYVLNDANSVSSYVKVFMYGGVTLEYTGTRAVIERINSSGSVRLRKDLLVELLSVDKLLRPNITYRYMIVKGNEPKYTWQLYENVWTPCSKICSGIRRAVSRCVEISTKQIVDEKFCEDTDRDVQASTTQECNTHCRLAWKIKEKHTCSTHCGRGVRKLIHQCVKIDNTHKYQHMHLMAWDLNEHDDNISEMDDVPWATPVDDNHCTDLKRPSDVEPCDGPCDSIRWHYEEWSECSKSCGSGIQSRKSFCVDSLLNKIDESACVDKPRFNQQSCNTKKCPTWSVGAEWTPCSVTCGRGYRIKPYHCHLDGKILRPEACDRSTEPLVREPCDGERRYCTQWVAADWYPINCPCHIHVQHRSVTCRPLDYRPETSSFSTVMFGGDSQQPLDDSHCVGLLKPNDTRPCNRDDDEYDECIAQISDIEDNSIVPTEVYVWRSGPWSECSRSCGGGTKSRNVACQSKSGTQREDRCDAKLKPVSRVRCHNQSCPTWNHGDWSSCNPDCHKYRLVICQDNSGSTLSNNRCSIIDRPANKSQCSEHINCRKKFTNRNNNINIINYPASLSPPSSSSSSSSSSLFPSTSSQFVTSGGVTNAFLDAITSSPLSSAQSDDDQTDITVLSSSSPPLFGHNFKWRVSEWSPCSQSCGRGVKTRHVSCLAIDQNVTLVDQYCHQLKKPKTTRNCYRSECTFVWQEGPWTECTKSCGPGNRYRNITCHRVLSHGRSSVHPETIPTGRRSCDPRTKPNESEKCLVRYCNEAYSWDTGPWQQCSHPCGPKGRQIRRIHCSHNGKKVPKRYCQPQLKPRRKKKCNQHRCPVYRNCMDVKRQLRSTANGEYEITLRNNLHHQQQHHHQQQQQQQLPHHRRVTLKIYCHDMHSPNPKEYLSLPNEGRDNYAEIYDKRLKNAESCPYGGQRNDLCDCIPTDSSRAGLTVFYKVRLNITSLKIIGNDYTFSRQNSGERVPYGTAGDCYSHLKTCPQGRFSINLNGTGLRLSSRVNWIESSRTSSKAINRVYATTVSGKCGGYCGGCEPDPNVGLLVEPDVT